jgi:hypothetical protein
MDSALPVTETGLAVSARTLKRTATRGIAAFEHAGRLNDAPYADAGDHRL